MENMTRGEIEQLIHDSNLGLEDERMATLYLIDAIPQVEIAVSIPLDRSTVSRRMKKIIKRIVKMSEKGKRKKKKK
ncbi:MAG: hypothetical protein ACI4I0_01125 [Acutalibacteraceae bacterium]